MKNLQIITNYKLASVFFLILFFLNHKGLSQKNTIKVTPFKFISGKTNISFERHLNEKWSMLIDAQRWFLKDKAKDQFLFFKMNQNSVLETNKGTRFSLEFRTYSFTKDKNRMKRNLYFGIGSFLGKHSISMKLENYSYDSFVESNGGFSNWWGSEYYVETTFVPKLNGEVDLVSGGIYLNTGIQWIFWKNVKLELGLISGKAWTNQENNHLTLYGTEPYILEEEREKLKESYTKGILGLFFQPTLNVGFSF